MSTTQDTVIHVIGELRAALKTPGATNDRLMVVVGTAIATLIGVVASELDVLQDVVGEITKKLGDIEASVDNLARHR